MQEATFYTFWGQWSALWYKNAKAAYDGGLEKIPVSELCEFKESYISEIFNRYITVRDIVKSNYFRNPKKKLSKYKRAAVLAYVVMLSDPIEYKYDFDDGIDLYFLKQNLAFYIGIGSIFQAFSEKNVTPLFQSEEKFFKFDELGKNDLEDGDDDFLTSVYKDMFFSEKYQNYNVLTMANVFGLVVERASKIGEFLLPEDTGKVV